MAMNETVPSQLFLIDHGLQASPRATRARPIPSSNNRTTHLGDGQSDLAPHSVAYSDERRTAYATHPSLGVVTSTDLQSSRTQLLVPRGVIREPTSIRFVPGSSTDDDGEPDDDVDQCDALYVTDDAGCRIWRIRLGHSIWADVPELIYQSYRSPGPNLLLQSLSDYARDGLSDEAKVAANNQSMRVRGVTVDRARGRMLWLQGDCLMCAPSEMDVDERPDERRDIWIIEDGLGAITSLSVDTSERWLLLRNDATGEEARLFLGDLLPEDEPPEHEEPIDTILQVDDQRSQTVWKDLADEWQARWLPSDSRGPGRPEPASETPVAVL